MAERPPPGAVTPSRGASLTAFAACVVAMLSVVEIAIAVKHAVQAVPVTVTTTLGEAVEQLVMAALVFFCYVMVVRRRRKSWLRWIGLAVATSIEVLVTVTFFQGVGLTETSTTTVRDAALIAALMSVVAGPLLYFALKD